jgi:hypothetical protein
MKHMNKGSKTLSDIELDSLLANPPLPADRGFSSRIENHVARELRKARGVFLAVSAAWVLISSAVLFKYSPSVFQMVKTVSVDISLLTIIDVSAFTTFSITPLFLVTVLASLVLFTIVKITD